MTAVKKLIHPIANEAPRPASIIYADFLPAASENIKHFSEKEAVKKIALPTMEGFHFEKVRHIMFLEASGNYTMIHFEDGRQVLVCKTLREVETMISSEKFVRIHRSHTIHLRHLKKYIRGKGGCVVLQNGATLAVSAGQKDVFLEAIHRFFS
jgi:two-component system, LytTR family, response regulator